MARCEWSGVGDPKGESVCGVSGVCYGALSGVIGIIGLSSLKDSRKPTNHYGFVYYSTHTLNQHLKQGMLINILALFSDE